MSLIHWWPLNGDLLDRGSNPKNGAIVGTADVTTSGILGKCLSGMSSSQTTAGVSVSNCNLVDELSGKDYSFACWFKVHGTHVHYNGTIMSSGNWNNKSWAVGVSQTNNQIDTFTNGYNKYISLGYTLTNNKWYHLASIQIGTKNYIYINGSLVGSSTQTGIYQSDASNLCIGRETYASGHFSFNGDICDVRIYDHALSIKEIQELSKGLMLHYTFNDIGSESTTNLITGLTQGGQTTVNSTLKTVTTSGTNADTYFYLKLSEAMVEGQTYTLQCYAENLPHGTYFNFPIAKQTNTSLSFYIYNGWNTYTFTANSVAASAGTTVLMDDSARTAWQNKCVFSCFQLEKKDHATAYVVGSRNNPYYDESGYNNDGTQNQITYTSNSNNGSYCASFNGTHSYIEVPNWKPTLPNEPYTIAFWVNPGENKTRDVYFGNHPTTNGTFNIERNASNYLRVYYNSDTPIGPISAITIPNGVWTHIVMTFDGTTFKAYKDGVEKYSKALSQTLSCTNTSWKIGSDYRTAVGTSEATRYKGLMSDFRIYASALTPAQVLELYESKAEIDKNQNVFTNEIIEQNEVANMVNLGSWEQGGIQDANGVDANNMNNRARTKYIPVLPNTHYYFQAAAGWDIRGVHFYRKDNAWISYAAIGSAGVLTTPEDCYYVRFVVQNDSPSLDALIANVATFGPVMVPGSAATTSDMGADTDVQVTKTYQIKTKDICENHDVGFFKDGTASGNNFYEI